MSAAFLSIYMSIPSFPTYQDYSPLHLTSPHLQPTSPKTRKTSSKTRQDKDIDSRSHILLTVGNLAISLQLSNPLAPLFAAAAAQQVESALVLHPAVSEAAVVGFPDPIKGQAICCYVTFVSG